MYLIIILIIFLVLLYIFFEYKEYFIICENIPLGPYLTYCTNIKYFNNKITAFCPSRDLNNKMISKSLDLNECLDPDNCLSINIDKNSGDLICA
jgi:hypothetical protein